MRFRVHSTRKWVLAASTYAYTYIEIAESSSWPLDIHAQNTKPFVSLLLYIAYYYASVLCSSFVLHHDYDSRDGLTV